MSIHLKVIYNYINSRIAEKEDVKDILQETMLSVWKGIKGFDNNSSFKTWCFGITKRKIADYYREAYKNATIPIKEVEDVLAVEDEKDSIDTKLIIEKAIASLNQTEKDIVFFAFNAQLSYSEISEIISIPVGTIKSKMSSIKEKLKKQLANGGGL
jgi:RNA polymerase sigma factor (sigma-70 family)